MRNLLHIPYLRPTLKMYCIISCLVGFIISFILIVFQPFGTAGFEHPNKYLILSGYGFVVSVTMIIFFWLSKSFVHKKRESNWNIIYEVIDIFLVLIISLLADYLYAVEVFNGSYRLSHLFNFLLIASSVAVLPVCIALTLLYLNWKDVVRSSIEKQDDNSQLDKTVSLQGVNKNSLIKTDIDNILLLKAHDNYVMLYILTEEKTKRHILRSTLKELKEQLSADHFLQCHRSYIINRHKIDQMIGNKSKASLKLDYVNKLVPVSRSAYDEVKALAG